MKNFQRNMTVSAAALVAALVMAPKSEAQERVQGRVEAQGRGFDRHEGGRTESRQELRENRSDRDRGHDRRDFSPSPRQSEWSPRPYSGFRGNGYGNGYGNGHGYGYGNGYGNGYGRGYGYGHAYGYGRGYGYGRSYGYGYSPFRSFGGIRFYSSCPSSDYVYITDGDYEGWVEPPYLDAVWLPGHYDRFGIWFGGRWR